MKKRKRGRPKGSCKGMPNNIACWHWVLSYPEKVKAFIERGSLRQKNEIVGCLNHWKNSNNHFFQKINGEEILKKLRR